MHNNRYDNKFKANVVKMVVERNRSIPELANDLGVSSPSLRRWVKLSKETKDPTQDRLSELEAENKELKRKLENANETVEVLKKSVAIFINPQKPI